MKAAASASGTFKIAGKLQINRLGFGAMRVTGLPDIWGPPQNLKEARAVLKRAIELGVNFFDTADSYGPEVAENMLAETLYPYPKDLVIATKGGLLRPSPQEWVPDCRPEYLKKCVENSLKRLRLDCIDLYQLHAIDPNVSLEVSLKALKDMQDQGKIRYIGVSNFSMAELERARKVIDVVSVQNLYNLSDRSSEDVLQYCQRHNIAFIPWFPLANGELVRPGGALDQIAKKKGVTPAQVVIAWLLKHSPVMVPIPGTSKTAHLEENVAAATIDLTVEEMNAIGR